MVTTLMNNLEYISYIRQRVKEIFPEWEEINAEYGGQPNNKCGGARRQSHSFFILTSSSGSPTAFLYFRVPYKDFP